MESLGLSLFLDGRGPAILRRNAKKVANELHSRHFRMKTPIVFIQTDSYDLTLGHAGPAFWTAELIFGRTSAYHFHRA
jgi:hypothetical protein